MEDGATSRIGGAGDCVGAGGCGVGVGGRGVGVGVRVGFGVGVEVGMTVGVELKVGVAVNVGSGCLLVVGEPPQAASRQAMREQQKMTVSLLANCTRWEAEKLDVALEKREYHIEVLLKRKRKQCAFS